MRLIDADALLEKFAELEATALDMCGRYMHDDDQTEWKRWSVILTERTAYRYDVLDAPTMDAMPIIRCRECRWGREACGNIECHVDLNIPSEYHGYDWYCPNGERKKE